MARLLRILAGLIASGLPLAAQAGEPFRISVNVDLVVLHPAVRDAQGRFVANLRQGDFEVFEDGIRQTIKLFQHEDIPVTVGLIIDHSGSMGPKLAEVIEAARTFVQASSPGDQMFVVNFNERVSLGLPVGEPFASGAAELVGAIASAPTAGMTALYDAVAAGQRLLQAGDREKKVLIVISDGGDNASSIGLDAVLKAAEQASTLIYTIGIFDGDDADRNPDALRRLARATGGEAFFPEKLDEVVAICGAIARDIRQQYTIGFASNHIGRPGAYRSLRVVARSPEKKKLQVRTRSGYIAGSDAGRGRESAGKW